MQRHPLTRALLLLVFCAYCWQSSSAQQLGAEPRRPNILWITSEDNGPQLGCYGDEFANTPHLDRLAARGMIYENCWSNAPVCAPARTTIVTGIYPTSLGAQHMRSQVEYPEDFQLYPQIFRELGYYCTNNSKEDYNLKTPEKVWDESSRRAHWRNRRPGQPFFAVFNYTISHESKLRTRPHEAVHDPSQVTVPPYHPDTPEVRQDWAQYYDRLTEMDALVGKTLAELEEDGLDDDTIVFYYGDHGSGMPRGKRWLYQSGLHVPLIVHVPERYQTLVKDQYLTGSSSERLVSFVDLMPTVLSLAGVRPPSYLQGEAFLGPYATPDPEYIYGFRDRMDERYDMSRAVRDQQYMYIRNFYPQRPQGAFLAYMFQTPTTQVWKQLYDEDRLNQAQAFFWQPKPSEELYDLEADPYQVNNLAGQPEHAETLRRFRKAVREWMLDVKDLGFLPEGMMLERAGREPPYTYGHSSTYDVKRLFQIADLATRPEAGELDALLESRVDSDNAVRFWVANGLLIRAMRDLQPTSVLQAARGMATDNSPYVRCVANETLARYGTPEDRAVAMKLLVNLANPRNSNTFVAMTALNSLDWCRPTRDEIGNVVQGIPDKDPTLPGRYQSYIPNLKKRIESIIQ